MECPVSDCKGAGCVPEEDIEGDRHHADEGLCALKLCGHSEGGKKIVGAASF